MKIEHSVRYKIIFLYRVRLRGLDNRIQYGTRAASLAANMYGNLSKTSLTRYPIPK